jgi:hypothetical protein
MHLATRYKVISKLLFLTSLMIAWAMVIVGVAKVPPPPPTPTPPTQCCALRCLPVSLNPVSSKQEPNRRPFAS